MRHLALAWMVVVCGCGSHEKQEPAPPPAVAAAQVASPTAPVAAHGHDHDMPAAPPALTIDGIAKGASIMASLGEYHRAITTTNPDAQAYFDQGLRLIYGFNHDEAARSFARATQLDPKCASCYWGLALVLGPNYNVPMLPDRF